MSWSDSVESTALCPCTAASRAKSDAVAPNEKNIIKNINFSAHMHLPHHRLGLRVSLHNPC